MALPMSPQIAISLIRYIKAKVSYSRALAYGPTFCLACLIVLPKTWIRWSSDVNIEINPGTALFQISSKR